MNKFIENFVLPSEWMNSSPQKIEPISFGGIKLPQNTIYLDFASSTPLDKRILEKMTPWMLGYFANSANRLHPMGELTEHALGWARTTLAKIFSVSFEEVIFTGSATESNNLFLRGLVENPHRKRNKIVYCATEHSSIIVTANTLSALSENIQIAELPVDEYGQINIQIAERVIDENTLCVCVMDVNNETGIRQLQLEKIRKISLECGALLHVDASQGFARSHLIAEGIDFDSLTISSAKIYGPKGAAALILKKRRPKIKLQAQLTGGGHEFDLRSSTPNIAAIMGFTYACLFQQQEASERIKYYEFLENAFCDELNKHIQVKFYGVKKQKIAGILTISFQNVNAMKLLEETRTVCASVGSACKTLQATASHVLVAMGIELENTLASFRVSFGLTNSEQEVREAAKILAQTAHHLREKSATLL
ncbi:cysteine desulfurase family protein [Fluviispira sanaruensis]|uniref:IscS subfamily cysteine desulfurase n=1 Tax=Fluviispira sanaruensis TaxID=2493639 RepID=A0A4P2VMD6_FLUSA|nr:aminotransferase class V-fold PLP-dependent enzyme [Fluviispira sanaruensis]BBH52609.1 IscS subfamily cysteine desulfurase [Fluviispira sanaruensis]